MVKGWIKMKASSQLRCPHATTILPELSLTPRGQWVTCCRTRCAAFECNHACAFLLVFDLQTQKGCKKWQFLNRDRGEHVHDGGDVQEMLRFEDQSLTEEQKGENHKALQGLERVKGKLLHLC